LNIAKTHHRKPLCTRGRWLLRPRLRLRATLGHNLGGHLAYCFLSVDSTPEGCFSVIMSACQSALGRDKQIVSNLKTVLFYDIYQC